MICLLFSSHVSGKVQRSREVYLECNLFYHVKTVKDYRFRSSKTIFPTQPFYFNFSLILVEYRQILTNDSTNRSKIPVIRVSRSKMEAWDRRKVRFWWL